MLYLYEPQPCVIRQFLSSQLAKPFSYDEVGATAGLLPEGYAINHRQEVLGRGAAIFDAACGALDRWEQLQLGWVRSWPLNAPKVDGESIAIIGRAFGLWWLNACRVVYTIDERVSHLPRYGYAHGTLPDHVASGEERFLLEMDESETVTLDILAFSRPNSMLARLGYPYMRFAQRRFGQESISQTRRATQVQASSNRGDDLGQVAVQV